MNPRVAITGIGLTTHLGKGIKTNWIKVAGEPSSALTQRLDFPDKGMDSFSRALHLSRSAISEALDNAHLITETSRSAMASIFSASKPLLSNGSWLSPDQINHQLYREFGFRGESRTVVAACATGAYSIAMGASWIEQGLCDIVLAGSVEPYPVDLILAGFQQLGVVSPSKFMRPFDAQRSGFVLGEGAGAIILENANHAKARGASIYGFLSGWALGADGHSAVAFNSNGQKIARAIEKSLLKAALDATAIGYVNAHGTATKINDVLETQALKHAFGSHSQRLSISATKSSTGHLLGAAGSVEFILTVLALQNQFIPPTRHLEHPDQLCDLDYTPGEGRAIIFDHAISLSFGFGGPIGVLVVSRGSRRGDLASLP